MKFIQKALRLSEREAALSRHPSTTPKRLLHQVLPVPSRRRLFHFFIQSSPLHGATYPLPTHLLSRRVYYIRLLLKQHIQLRIVDESSERYITEESPATDE